MNKLIWEDGKNVEFDHTVMFGHGYDFFGLNFFSQSAKGSNGNYLIWPKNKGTDYSLYRDSDGMMAFEKFKDEESCKQAAEKWNEEILEKSQ